MDFGKILDEWDGQKGKKKTKQSQAHREMEKWLDANPPVQESHNQDDLIHENAKLAERRKALRQLRPQDSLDLHGTRLKDVYSSVDTFLRASHNNGYKKVLIIHGKGNHSRNGPVLLDAVGHALQRHPLAGEMGFSHRKNGGRGATWVIIR